MESLIVKGIVSLLASFVFIASVLYVAIHKSSRIKKYKIGYKSTDAKRLKPNAFYPAFFKRMMKDPSASMAHNFIMIGFMLTAVGYIFNLIQVIVATASGSIFLKGAFFNVISVIFNLGIVLLFVGSCISLFRRLSGKNRRLSKEAKHIEPLVAFIVLALAAAVYEGFAGVIDSSTAPFAFAGTALFLPFRSAFAGGAGIGAAHVAAWCVLSLAASAGMLSLIFGKMPHMSAAMVEFMGKKDLSKPYLNQTEKQVNKLLDGGDVDEDTVFGAKYIENFDFNQIAQLDMCAGCGRCEDVCPSFLSGKELSPMRMVKNNRKALDHYHKPEDSALSAVNGTDQMVWQCNLCHACENTCPSQIETTARILDMRRNLVLNSGKTIPEFKKVIDNTRKQENPYGLGNEQRESFLKEMGIPYLNRGEKVDYVLWLGCHAYFDDRMKNVIRSLVHILQRAGKTFAVLKEESCCGDPVRSIGDELSFQQTAKNNIDLFGEYGIDSILTICPHCYTVFKDEYPLLGGSIKVKHYLEVLKGLVAGQKLSAGTGAKKRVFYHDSCYLGRLNGLYEEPRELISLLGSGFEQVTIPEEKENSLCCGGGGSRIWADEKVQNRPSGVKLDKIKELNVDVFVTSCPYCLNIFTDAKNSTAPSIEVVDLMELLDRSLVAVGAEAEKK